MRKKIYFIASAAVLTATGASIAFFQKRKKTPNIIQLPAHHIQILWNRNDSYLDVERWFKRGEKTKKE